LTIRSSWSCNYIINHYFQELHYISND